MARLDHSEVKIREAGEHPASANCEEAAGSEEETGGSEPQNVTFWSEDGSADRSCSRIRSPRRLPGDALTQNPATPPDVAAKYRRAVKLWHLIGDGYYTEEALDQNTLLVEGLRPIISGRRSTTPQDTP